MQKSVFAAAQEEHPNVWGKKKCLIFHHPHPLLTPTPKIKIFELSGLL